MAGTVAFVSKYAFMLAVIKVKCKTLNVKCKRKVTSNNVKGRVALGIRSRVRGLA